MADPKGSVRVNISVPAKLKHQMDETDPSVNWSGVAAEAFRAKLTDLQARAVGKSMKDVVGRLKAAHELEKNQLHREGVQIGEKWAKETASPRQLWRLNDAVLTMDFMQTNKARMRPGMKASDLRTAANKGKGPAAYVELYTQEQSLRTIEEALADIVFDLEYPALDDAIRHWKAVIGDEAAYRLGEPMFAQGFIEGSIAVWAEVSDEFDGLNR